MDGRQREQLKQLIQDAKDLNDILELPGWKNVLEKRINARIEDKHKVWLKAKTPEVAETLRLRVAGYQGIFDIIQKVQQEGRNAETLLRNPEFNQDNS